MYFFFFVTTPTSTYFIKRVAIQTHGKPQIAALNEEKKRKKEEKGKRGRKKGAATALNTKSLPN
jgi:hypothetical protein